MIGSHMVIGWINTQAVIVLSSGEVEYYGMVKGASIGIGVIGIMRDYHQERHVRISSDSSAALGISRRRGLGKVRHIELNQLWLQEKVSMQEVEVRKVRGEDNLVVALTKYLEGRKIQEHMNSTGQHVKDGRHELAPDCS